MVCDWSILPDLVLFKIFINLDSVSDLINCSKTCKRWYHNSSNNTIWNCFFKRDYNTVKIDSIKCSNWKQEYLRLSDTVPKYLYKKLEKHQDEVLHVSFSHDGKYFVSSSKDAKAIIWRVSDFEPVEVHDMNRYQWKFTWAGQFSPSNNRLMLSGVINDPNGELAILERKYDKPGILGETSTFQLICRTINDPYDVLGSWWTERYFLSGSISSIWACEPAPNEEDPNLLPNGCYRHRLIDYDFNFESPTYLRHLICHLFPDQVGATPLNEVLCYDLVKDQRYYVAYMSATRAYIPHKIGFFPLSPDTISQDDFETNLSESEISVEFNGHIIGVAVSKDKKLMYVNVRSWPDNSIPSFEQAPPISSEIELKVLDLRTFKLVESLVLTGHKGYTPSESAFYLYLDTSENFIGSGSENMKGYIWERNYGIHLATLDHDSCVGSVAFNPIDEQMCISASDDFTLKVWKSKNRLK